jgi:hypothetical protein
MSLRHSATPSRLQTSLGLLPSIVSNEREKVWYELVEEYTSRSLTKPTDTLPAIYGLASFFWGGHKDGYIAGLLKHDIHRGLTWYVPHQSRRRFAVREEDHPEMCIPSWSWASTDYKVDFHSNNTRSTLCRSYNSRGLKDAREMHRRIAIQSKRVSDNIQLAIFQARVDTLDRDPFGQVSFGYLKVKGRVLPVESSVGTNRIYWDEPDMQKEKTKLPEETQGGLLLAVDGFGTSGWGALVIVPVPSKSNHYQRIGYVYELDNNDINAECPFYDAALQELILI